MFWLADKYAGMQAKETGRWGLFYPREAINSHVVYSYWSQWTISIHVMAYSHHIRCTNRFRCWSAELHSVVSATLRNDMQRCRHVVTGSAALLSFAGMLWSPSFRSLVDIVGRRRGWPCLGGWQPISGEPCSVFYVGPYRLLIRQCLPTMSVRLPRGIHTLLHYCNHDLKWAEVAVAKIRVW